MSNLIEDMFFENVNAQEYIAYHQEASCDAFVTGFRIGAKLVMDIFAVSDEELPSLF